MGMGDAIGKCGVHPGIDGFDGRTLAIIGVRIFIDVFPSMRSPRKTRISRRWKTAREPRDGGEVVAL